MPFGAELQQDGGGVRFRLWAPSVERVELECSARRRRASRSSHADAALPPTAGTKRTLQRGRRRHALPLPHHDGTDARACWCPTRPRAATPTTCTATSAVVDPAAFAWRDDAWRGRPWHEAVVYELHVGTFTPEGTLRRRAEPAAGAGRARHHRDRADAAGRLPGYARLGLRRRAALRARCLLRHARRSSRSWSTRPTRSA